MTPAPGDGLHVPAFTPDQLAELHALDRDLRSYAKAVRHLDDTRAAIAVLRARARERRAYLHGVGEAQAGALVPVAPADPALVDPPGERALYVVRPPGP